MTAAIILGPALCLLEPGFAFSLRRLEWSGSHRASLLRLAPVVSGNGYDGAGDRLELRVQTICHEDRLRQNDKSQSRSER